MLKKLFGPSKEAIWQQLSKEVVGKYVDGGFFGQDKVEVQHEDWQITLDTQVVTTGKVTVIYTQLSAPFINKDNFRFNISRRNIFTDIGTFFGMQDISIGEPEFDHDFVIKANNEEKVKALLHNTVIRDLLRQNPSVHFQIKQNEGLFSRTFPEGVDRLYFRNLGVIKDIARLKSLFSLFSETLDQLGKLDTAYGYKSPVK